MWLAIRVNLQCFFASLALQNSNPTDTANVNDKKKQTAADMNYPLSQKVKFDRLFRRTWGFLFGIESTIAKCEN